jgi:hypothetical protein
MLMLRISSASVLLLGASRHIANAAQCEPEKVATRYDCGAGISERLQPGHLVFPLREADVLRTPEFQHPVQCVHGNSNLGCSTPISAGS